MTTSKYSLEEIWVLGCRGDKLTPENSKRFAAMARSRFHTFQMGVSHAETEPSEDYLMGLVRGLATELKTHPGLKKVWLRMPISQSDIGQQVNLQLEKLEQRVVH